MTPAQVRSATASLLGITDLPRGTTLDVALAMVAKGEPAPLPDGKSPAPQRRQTRPQHERGPKTACATPAPRGRASKRARALVREQLANGPRPGKEVQAAAYRADISERSLIAAADAPGVRTRRGPR